MWWGMRDSGSWQVRVGNHEGSRRCGGSQARKSAPRRVDRPLRPDARPAGRREGPSALPRQPCYRPTESPGAQASWPWTLHEAPGPHSPKLRGGKVGARLRAGSRLPASEQTQSPEAKGAHSQLRLQAALPGLPGGPHAAAGQGAPSLQFPHKWLYRNRWGENDTAQRQSTSSQRTQAKNTVF